MSRNSRFPGSRLLLYLTGLAGLFRLATSTEAHGTTEPIDPTTRAEPQTLDARTALLTGLGILVGLWLVVVLIYPLFTFFVQERIGAKALPPQPMERTGAPPEPRIQSNPRQDLQQYEKTGQDQLTQYHWVDRSNGIVSIPIDQAIDLLAARGVPPSKPGGKDYYPPQAGTRETGFEGKVEPEPR